MDYLQAILTRVSIRKYTGEKITDEHWDTIFKAGFSAPSAHNLQPWHFIRIDDDGLLTTISAVHPYAKMLPQAGGAILVCGDNTIQEMTGFMVEDCSAAIENMLITINGLGLGGVWVGVHPVDSLIDSISELFDLPEAIIPIGIIAVGHRESQRAPINKYKPERIHHNKWA